MDQLEQILEKMRNPLGYSEVERSMIHAVAKAIVDVGPSLWIGEKEETPVSLEIPHILTKTIGELCKKEGLNQWDFEKKLYTSLVLDGLTFKFLTVNSDIVSELVSEAKKKLLNKLREDSDDTKRL